MRRVFLVCLASLAVAFWGGAITACGDSSAADGGLEEPAENGDDGGYPDSDDAGDPDPGDEPGDPDPGDEPGDPDPGDEPGDPDPGDEPGDPGPGDEPGDPGPGDEPGDPGPGDEDPADVPLDEVDDVRLYINIGDSLAAGYNASGLNGSGGKGYARLFLENHPDYPAYDDYNLRALFIDVRFENVSDSGDTSHEALDHLRSTSLPQVDGDVVVTLTCGGNDFNNDIWVMIQRVRTEAAADELEGNYIEMVNLLRDRYEKPEQGHHVVFLMTNIHDPTAGTGQIPPGFDQGFCEMINNPMFIPLRETVIGNLEFFNQRMAEITGNLGGYLVDNHAVFFDHGMNAEGADRWLDDDCVHPINEGHHQLRREEWFVFTGERY